MAMRRMWAMMRRAVFDRAAGEPLERLAGRGHGFVHVGEQPEAALVAAARRSHVAVAPLFPSRVSTCSTTLRISFSSTCMIVVSS